jgi:uncharacterized protein YcgI (DUF1989 family)
MHYVSPTPVLDRKFYESLRSAVDDYRFVEQFEVPPVSGKGFTVPAGHCARLVCHKGAQIVDVCLFNAHEPEEHLSAAQTLNKEGSYLTTFSRLWSNLPRFRPMMTIIEDTVITRDSETHIRHHSILGAHCNPQFWQWGLGTSDHPFAQTKNCYHNLLEAVTELGIPTRLIHDNFNLFEKCGIHTRTGEMVIEASDVVEGDHVDFYAEFDVSMAISLCPQGSAKNLPSNPVQDTKPLLIEIYDTGIQPVPMDFTSLGVSWEPVETRQVGS